MLKRTDYLTRTYGKPEGWTLVVGGAAKAANDAL